MKNWRWTLFLYFFLYLWWSQSSSHSAPCLCRSTCCPQLSYDPECCYTPRTAKTQTNTRMRTEIHAEQSAAQLLITSCCHSSTVHKYNVEVLVSISILCRCIFYFPIFHKENMVPFTSLRLSDSWFVN